MVFIITSSNLFTCFWLFSDPYNSLMPNSYLKLMFYSPSSFKFYQPIYGIFLLIHLWVISINPFIDNFFQSIYGLLALVLALRAGPSQQMNL